MAGGGYAAMVGDLTKITNAVAAKAGNGGISIIASAAQAISIGLQLVQGSPWPLLTSTALPAGSIIAVANAGIVAAAKPSAAVMATGENHVAQTGSYLHSSASEMRGAPYDILVRFICSKRRCDR